MDTTNAAPKLHSTPCPVGGVPAFAPPVVRTLTKFPELSDVIDGGSVVGWAYSDTSPGLNPRPIVIKMHDGRRLPARVYTSFAR
jgi:hypothetical protein